MESRSFPTRRAFLITGAAACAAAAAWTLHRPSTVAEAAADVAPGPVTLVQFSADGKRTGKITVARTVKPDAEWKQQLSPVSYNVTRHAGTERAYTGDSWDLHDKGLFRCICCDTALFSSETKFDSGTGWPSFWKPIAAENVREIHDNTFGMDRTAIACADCDGPPRPRLRRWTGAHRPALLHELRRDEVRKARLIPAF